MTATARQFRTGAPLTSDAISPRMRAHIAAGYGPAAMSVPVSIRHHHRLTAVPNRSGTFTIRGYYATATGCTCPRGSAGCEHSAGVRVIISAAAEPLQRQAEMQQQDRDTSPAAAPADPFTLTDPFGPATDAMGARFAPPLTRDEAAAELGVTPEWVRRLVRTGRLSAVDGQISAASVTAYAATRHTGRFGTGHPVTEKARALADADRALTRARKLESEADRLRAAYKATCERYGVGGHDGWVIAQKDNGETADLPAIRDNYAARKEAMPMKPKAPSWVLTRAA